MRLTKMCQELRERIHVSIGWKSQRSFHEEGDSMSLEGARLQIVRERTCFSIKLVKQRTPRTPIRPERRASHKKYTFSPALQIPSE